MKPTYRFVLRAYTPEYRAVYGDELAETAAELGGGTWSARQSAALLAGGLRTRALATSQGEAKNVWGQALLTMVGILYAMNAATLGAWLLGVKGDMASIEADPVVGLALSVVGLVTLTRHMNWAWLAGFAGLNGLAAYLASGGLSLYVIAVAATGGVAWAVFCTSASRSFSLAAGVGLVVLGLAASWVSGVPAAGSAGAAVCALAAGIVLVRLDPRAIAVGALMACWILAVGLISGLGSFALRESSALLALGVMLSVTAMLIVITRYGIRHLHKNTIAGAR